MIMKNIFNFCFKLMYYVAKTITVSCGFVAFLTLAIFSSPFIILMAPITFVFCVSISRGDFKKFVFEWSDFFDAVIDYYEMMFSIFIKKTVTGHY